MSFNHKTIEELHDLLVSKEISATELTQATLDDIEGREEAINAFVTVAEEVAFAQAKAIDEKGNRCRQPPVRGFHSLSKTISQQMAS